MGFSKKTDAETGISAESLDQELKDDLLKQATENQLPCAVAFAISANHNKPPAEIGKYADHLGIRLAKCQLGLFGYTPNKKKVAPSANIPTELKQAIEGPLKDGRLCCLDTWDIAKKLGIPKMKVSSACEAMKIKITACQLGAF